ncbi:MAG: hypothetical protein FWG77_08195 [Treponema sp.]|nr:hypothetical protein [Treponema sp.]
MFTGCTGLIHRGGEFLEGSRDRQVLVYRGEQVLVREMVSAEGANFIEVSHRDWPALAFRGSMPDSSGRVHFTEINFLSTHVHGWNEFSLDVLGSAVFRVTPGGDLVFYMEGDIERVQISGGRILLRSNLLTGTSALVPLRNRRERILALIEWMEKLEFESQRDFENHFKPILFPELILPRSRPGAYTTENAERAWADSVRWNHTYTENNFPFELWEYRNTGAMLRDWEEALPWIFMEYSFDSIVRSFVN